MSFHTLRSSIVWFLIVTMLVCGTVQTAQALVWPAVLRWLIGYVVSKGADYLLERYALQSKIPQARTEAAKELQESKQELAATREELKQAATNTDQAKVVLRVDDLEEKIKILGEVQERIDDLERQVASRMTDEELRSYIERVQRPFFISLNNRMDALESRVADLDVRVARLTHDVEELKRRIKELEERNSVQPVLGLYYEGVHLFPETWREHYSNVTVPVPDLSFYGGVGVSIGFWFNRTFCLDARMHYIPRNQEKGIGNTHAVTQQLGLEGLGFTGRAVATFHLGKTFYFDLGGGYQWTNYRASLIVDSSALGIYPIRTVQKRSAHGDPVFVTGLKLDGGTVLIFGSVEFLLRRLTFKGYHLTGGLLFLI